MIERNYPLESLGKGCWFKLICGASFQHLPAIRSLVLAYTLAGADCIDVAADPAVIAVAHEAINVATRIRGITSPSSVTWKPLLMVSLNDGEDPHFRKADFPAENCPSTCDRPCERVCPANAIALSGVITDRCYGCGRCLSVCPIQHISACSYVSTPHVIIPLILEAGIDALEIHTQVGHFKDFLRLWKVIQPWVGNLKLLAISCPDDINLIDYLRSLCHIITPIHCPLIWQTDGRPMSGDIGMGSTRVAIQVGQKVLASKLPGYVQLAGGTNQHTVPKLRDLNLLPNALSNDVSARANPLKARERITPLNFALPHFAGVAYGSYARVLLTPILEQLETLEITAAKSVALETVPELLHPATNLACSLVSQLKPCVQGSTNLQHLYPR